MKLLSLIFSLLLLSGCDSSKSLVELCKDNPQICQEFGQNSWCKDERIDVVLPRIDLKTLKQYQSAYSLDGDFLDDVASNTLANIESGEFKTPKY